MFGLTKTVVWLLLILTPPTDDKPATFALMDTSSNMATCEALKEEVKKQAPLAPLMCVAVIPTTRI